MALPLLCLLAAAAAVQGAAAVEYSAVNNAVGTPGGDRFQSQVGLDYSKQVMASASAFIWNTFRQGPGADRKDVRQVSLVVESMSQPAYTFGSSIHLNANYVAGYPGGDVRTEVVGVLYHEMVHVWQWNGGGAAPLGLTEGIADYVRLKAGYAPGHWKKPGEGSRWYDGYEVTAYFLDYCESLGGGGFVAGLNQKMRDRYSQSFFVELLGKTVDQLWTDYKAKYGS